MLDSETLHKLQVIYANLISAIEFFDFTQLDGDRAQARVEPLPEHFRSFNGVGRRARLVGEREIVRLGGDGGARGSVVEGLEFA